MSKISYHNRMTAEEVLNYAVNGVLEVKPEDICSLLIRVMDESYDIGFENGYDWAKILERRDESEIRFNELV